MGAPAGGGGGVGDEIIFKSTAAGHMAGKEFPAAIAAPDELLRIDIVKDGHYIFTTQPAGKLATLRFP